MTDLGLAGIADQLDTLAEQPVTSHPDVLDAVHQALVAELDTLAAAALDPQPG